jgi:hypothetical protein
MVELFIKPNATNVMLKNQAWAMATSFTPGLTVKYKTLPVSSSW